MLPFRVRFLSGRPLYFILVSVKNSVDFVAYDGAVGRRYLLAERSGPVPIVLADNHDRSYSFLPSSFSDDDLTPLVLSNHRPSRLRKNVGHFAK